MLIANIHDTWYLLLPLVHNNVAFNILHLGSYLTIAICSSYIYVYIYMWDILSYDLKSLYYSHNKCMLNMNILIYVSTLPESHRCLLTYPSGFLLSSSSFALNLFDPELFWHKIPSSLDSNMLPLWSFVEILCNLPIKYPRLRILTVHTLTLILCLLCSFHWDSLVYKGLHSNSI